MREALQNGALQSLKAVELGSWILGDNDLTGFVDALEESGCAKWLVDLRFQGCEFGAEGMSTLADRLRRDAFPSLKTLYFSECPNITDVGVVVLSKALLEAEQTLLTNLVLYNVGMGDEGITAVASLASQGRMEKMELLNIANNQAVTEQGIIALARAIKVRRLPKLECILLEDISGMTASGTCAIVLTLLKRCPELRRIHLVSFPWNDDCLRDGIRGMLDVENRTDIIMTYKKIGDDDEDY